MKRNLNNVLKPRASNIPSLSHSSSKAESSKKSSMPIANKRNRSSAERLSRISLASTKVTPNKFTTPIHNNYLALPSSNVRLSAGTMRSSFGPNSKKELWPMSDPSFKTHCIDNIMEFFGKRNANFNRNTLRKPTGNEFKNIFTFIYCHIDPTYKPSAHYEKDIPDILKMIRYPITMQKSSFVSVGSPHTWPSVLAMLNWLVNLIDSVECFVDEETAFKEDFTESASLIRLRFEGLVDLFKTDDIDVQTKILHEYKEKALEEHQLNPEDLASLEREAHKVETELKDFPSSKHQVTMYQEQVLQLNKDLEKLSEFNSNLSDYIGEKDHEKNILLEQLREKENEVRKNLEQIEELRVIKSAQNLSSVELKRVKNRASEIAQEMEDLLIEEKQLKEEVSSSQIEMSKGTKKFRALISEFNSLCRHLDIDCPNLSSSNVQETIEFWEQEVIPFLKDKKKLIRETLFEKKNNLAAFSATKEKSEERVTELKASIKSLECKKKRLDEELKCVKEESASELKQLQMQCDAIIERSHQARIQPKANIYEKQKEIEDLKIEKESWMMKDQEQRKLEMAKLDHCEKALEKLVEHKKRMSEEFKCKAEEKSLQHLKNILEILEE